MTPENVRPWPSRLLLKPDNVVNDATCFSMFQVFNYLWRHSFIPEVFKPYALDLAVLPAGLKFGFIGYVENSQSASNYDWEKLFNCNEQQLQVFLRTAAGSIVAGHILGIGDRHQDNIMLREVELPNVGTCIQFFQLDFKHCCGMRCRIDADPIAIPSKMKDVLERIKVKHKLWEDFGKERVSSSIPANSGIQDKFDELVAMCAMAFRVLRRSSGFVMHLVRLLNRSADLADEWESYFMESFWLAMTEDEAVVHLCKRIRNSSNTLAKFVKDMSHSAAALNSQ